MIVIEGPDASGKSTLARYMSRALGLPLVSVMTTQGLTQRVFPSCLIHMTPLMPTSYATDIRASRTLSTRAFSGGPLR